MDLQSLNERGLRGKGLKCTLAAGLTLGSCYNCVMKGAR